MIAFVSFTVVSLDHEVLDLGGRDNRGGKPAATDKSPAREIAATYLAHSPTPARVS
jgi:hypothetical protein